MAGRPGLDGVSGRFDRPRGIGTRAGRVGRWASLLLLLLLLLLILLLLVMMLLLCVWVLGR